MIRKRQKQQMRGAVLVESMAVICALFFAFLCMLQIYHWAVNRLVCQYSSFYAAKGMTLGYRLNLVRRSARVAAIVASGDSMGNTSGDERADALNYMLNGDASGVWYANWYPQGNDDPEIYLCGDYGDNFISSSVILFNSPLIWPGLEKFLGIAENPIPNATTKGFDHSKLFLEDAD